MALLNPVAVLLSHDLDDGRVRSLPPALPQALPEARPKPMASDRIAWIERQFKTCSGTACPTPTRKTLAIVELPVATNEPAPPVAAVQPSPSPVASDSPVATAAEPATATILFEYGQDTPTADGQRELERLAAIAANYSAHRAIRPNRRRRRQSLQRPSRQTARRVRPLMAPRQRRRGRDRGSCRGPVLLPRSGTHRSGAPEQPPRRGTSRRPARRAQ
jgi:hypothetical protein